MTRLNQTRDQHHAKLKSKAPILLDLRFLELDMLAHDGIIFFERQLFGLRARIFLGDIEKASVRRAGELDLDGGWLSHCPENLN